MRRVWQHFSMCFRMGIRFEEDKRPNPHMQDWRRCGKPCMGLGAQLCWLSFSAEAQTYMSFLRFGRPN